MSMRSDSQFKNGHGAECNGGAGIVLKIKTKNFIELRDIGRIWIAIDAEYRHFSKNEGPPYNRHRVLVRTVRPGCIEAFLAIGPALGSMVVATIFARKLFQSIENCYDPRKKGGDDIDKNTLSNIKEIAAPIKKNKGSSLSMTMVEYTPDGSAKPVQNPKMKTTCKFDSSEAEDIVKEVKSRLKEIERIRLETIMLEKKRLAKRESKELITMVEEEQARAIRSLVVEVLAERILETEESAEKINLATSLAGALQVKSRQ